MYSSLFSAYVDALSLLVIALELVQLNESLVKPREDVCQDDKENSPDKWVVVENDAVENEVK